MFTLFYTFENIRWGYVLLVLDTFGNIYYAGIGDHKPVLLASMLSDFKKIKNTRVRSLPKPTEAMERTIKDYVAMVEEPRAIDVLNKRNNIQFLFGTSLQKKVWRYLMENTQASNKLTYGTITQKLGLEKNMSRVIGSACGANRIALLVPCHRVVPKNGEITGYRWGSHIKKDVLKLEESSNSNYFLRSFQKTD